MNWVRLNLVTTVSSMYFMAFLPQNMPAAYSKAPDDPQKCEVGLETKAASGTVALPSTPYSIFPCFSVRRGPGRLRAVRHLRVWRDVARRNESIALGFNV